MNKIAGGREADAERERENRKPSPYAHLTEAQWHLLQNDQLADLLFRKAKMDEYERYFGEEI